MEQLAQHIDCIEIESVLVKPSYKKGKRHRTTSFWLSMANNGLSLSNTSENTQTADTLLVESKSPASDLLTDLDRISLPARPLAEGNGVDSSNTSWEQVNGSGSGVGSVQYQGVEDEACGNLTSGPSHTRADATAAGIPSTAQVMSLSPGNVRNSATNKYHPGLTHGTLQ